MSKETFAIINDQDQVVNHIIVDKDAPDFEEVMAGQLSFWNCVRYVETTNEQPIIILDPSPEIWTTHSEETGFVLPTLNVVPSVQDDHEKVTISGRVYPADSLLIKENADKRPAGWSLPAGEVEVSLANVE